MRCRQLCWRGVQDPAACKRSLRVGTGRHTASLALGGIDLIIRWALLLHLQLPALQALRALRCLGSSGSAEEDRCQPWLPQAASSVALLLSWRLPLPVVLNKHNTCCYLAPCAMQRSCKIEPCRWRPLHRVDLQAGSTCSERQRRRASGGRKATAHEATAATSCTGSVQSQR